MSTSRQKSKVTDDKTVITLGQQVKFWLVVLIVLVGILWFLGGILLPFIAGLVLAYFLDPVADWLEERNMPRLAATILIVGFFVILLILLLIFLLPILIDQIASFASDLPSHVQNILVMVKDVSPEWLLKEIEASGIDMKGPVSGLADRASGLLGTVLQSMLSGGLALVNLLSLLVVTPIVAFYMLNDWDRMVGKIDSWIPRGHVESVRQIAYDADLAIAGFIRGQSTVCIVLAVLYAIALTAVGLDSGLLIGLSAGILSFIPYLGAIVGGLLAIGMALVQFWPDWTMIAIVAAIFVVGQFLEGNFLTPKLVGDSVGLHPVWLMFSLFAAGYLFGFVGMLIAVPVAAAIRVLLRFALSIYMESPVYVDADGDMKVFAPVATSRVRRKAGVAVEGDEDDK